MPLRIGNYGEWSGDRPGGHHPPACTCFDCNEAQNNKDATEVSNAYDVMLRGTRRDAAEVANAYDAILRKTSREHTPRERRYQRKGGSGSRWWLAIVVSLLLIMVLAVGGIASNKCLNPSSTTAPKQTRAVSPGLPAALPVTDTSGKALTAQVAAVSGSGKVDADKQPQWGERPTSEAAPPIHRDSRPSEPIGGAGTGIGYSSFILPPP